MGSKFFHEIFYNSQFKKYNCNSMHGYNRNTCVDIPFYISMILQIYIYDFTSSKNLSEQLYQILNTLVRFLFTALFCSHLIANVMILIVSSLLTSLSIFFNKKKLILYCIVLRVINNSRYGPLTLEDILSLVL